MKHRKLICYRQCLTVYCALVLCIIPTKGICDTPYASGHFLSVVENQGFIFLNELYNWSNNWEQIIAIDIDNDDSHELLFYSSTSFLADNDKGLADIYDVLPSGELKLIKRHTNWSSNWEIIVAVDIDNDGKDELLLYDSDSPYASDNKGLGDILNITAKAQFSLIKRHTNWSSEWEQIIATNISDPSDQELLFYTHESSITGAGFALGDFYKITPTGDLRLLKRHTNWFNKWVKIVSADIDGDDTDELIFYAPNSVIADPGKGLGDIYDITDSGDLSLLTRHTDWYADWEHIVAVDIDDSLGEELFFWKTIAEPKPHGIGALYRMWSDGSADQLAYSDKMKPFVKNVVATKSEISPIDGSSDILLYSSQGGQYTNIGDFGYKSKQDRFKNTRLTGNIPFAWIVLRFPDGSEAINNKLNPTSVQQQSQYFSEISEGRLKINNLFFGSLNVNTKCNLGQNPLRGSFAADFRVFAIKQAINAGLDPFMFDIFPENNNLTSAELPIYVSSNCPAPPNGYFGVTREVGNADIGANMTYSGPVGSGGANATMATIVHESLHVIGKAFDMYPSSRLSRDCKCDGASIMGTATVWNNAPFTTQRIHLDPVHRIWYGWLEPRIFDIYTNNPSVVNIGLTRNAVPIKPNLSPIIIYNLNPASTIRRMI